jgi:hypothetical protein
MVLSFYRIVAKVLIDGVACLDGPVSGMDVCGTPVRPSSLGDSILAFLFFFFHDGGFGSFRCLCRVDRLLLCDLNCWYAGHVHRFRPGPKHAYEYNSRGTRLARRPEGFVQAAVDRITTILDSI